LESDLREVRARLSPGPLWSPTASKAEPWCDPEPDPPAPARTGRLPRSSLNNTLLKVAERPDGADGREDEVPSLIVSGDRSDGGEWGLRVDFLESPGQRWSDTTSRDDAAAYLFSIRCVKW